MKIYQNVKGPPFFTHAVPSIQPIEKTKINYKSKF